jgi:outer membrane biosynthesis protein TonB
MPTKPEMSPLRFAASVGVLLVATLADTSAQTATAPRLRESRIPAQMPYAVGGGEVTLELLVDASGAVSRVEPLRVTPPYTEQLIEAAATWKFEVARAPADQRATAVAPVLVVAVIRPPATYSGPSLGTPPQTLNRPSSLLPQVAAVTTPPYPPLAVGSGMVLVELEMNRRAELRGYRVVSPPSGFDNAALDAVRSWRFIAPDAPDAPERFFVYAVLGFREPVGPTRRPLR